MSTPRCPECGKPSTGNFCQHCGAQLGGQFCNQCGAELGGGAKFCNQCGAKVAGGGARVPAGARREAAAAALGGYNLPWWIAGAAMFVLIVVLGVQMVTPGPAAPPPATQPQTTAPFAGGAGGGVPPDLSQMTPREAADRLFTRVMQQAEAGDMAGAQAFLPMAFGAYERLPVLDADALFHLSLLNGVGGDSQAALAHAEQILADDPNHVLGLRAAAEAEAELGREEEAAARYRHLLDVLDSEIARGLPEYEAHANIMESVRGDAEAFLAGR